MGRRWAVHPSISLRANGPARAGRNGVAGATLPFALSPSKARAPYRAAVAGWCERVSAEIATSTSVSAMGTMPFLRATPARSRIA